MLKPVKVGLSLMPTQDFFEASSLLFDLDEVDVLEWSFDTVWPDNNTPEWCSELIEAYSSSGALLGHGVYYSPFSAEQTDAHSRWLENLSSECKRWNYNHISEHFGFMIAGNYSQAAPIPIPMNEESIEVGVSSLNALKEASNRPVGLENLALAFSAVDVQSQGEFLDKVLEAVDGFLLLDLHNLYCQAVNFKIPATELLESYPLHRVKEIHLSGGSWSEGKTTKRKIRRDTHDGRVPDEVFTLLREALLLCPDLEYIILERLGGTMNKLTSQDQFCSDYRKILEVADGLRS